MCRRANVKWAVHWGDEAEPRYDLAIVQGDSYQYVKSSLYGTIVMRMVMDACEAVFADLPPEDQKLGFQAVCLQVNTALGEQGNLARLLLSESAKRPWKFDLDPYTATQNYGGKRSDGGALGFLFPRDCEPSGRPHPHARGRADEGDWRDNGKRLRGAGDVV